MANKRAVDEAQRPARLAAHPSVKVVGRLQLALTLARGGKKTVDASMVMIPLALRLT